MPVTGRFLFLKQGSRQKRHSNRGVFMVAGESVLLSLKEAVEAVCKDFQQYPPQILLFSQVIQELTKGKTIVKREGQKNGAWVTDRRASEYALDGGTANGRIFL